jgi:hypothetical protein
MSAGNLKTRRCSPETSTIGLSNIRQKDVHVSRAHHSYCSRWSCRFLPCGPEPHPRHLRELAIRRRTDVSAASGQPSPHRIPTTISLWVYKAFKESRRSSV